MIRQAFRANLIPAVALWGFAFALLLLYNVHPATKSALDALAAFKKSLGLGFSMPAQAFVGGLLPFFFQRLQKGTHRKTKLAHVPFLMLFFSVMGAMTDTFYNAQAHVFGNSPQWQTVAIKTIVDMLLYTSFLSTPFAVLAFSLKDNGFNLSATRVYLGKNWMLTRVFPVYIAALLVWTPTVMVLYALPLPLQYPFQAIVQIFWGLILVIMTAKT